MSWNDCPNPTPGGILLIDKPSAFTSHDVIAITRRVLGVKKIGHSGTLDPMATGLLILLVGRAATKQQDRFLKLSKVYSATLTLGQETDSWDADGHVTAAQDVPPFTDEDLQQAVRTLSGTIHQPIPFVSAKKINGRPMYDLAREGKKLERKYNEVTVEWQDVRRPDEKTISFTVRGSCGTYVRSLGYLLAHRLGTVGHLTALRRLAIGPYSVEEAFDGTQLKTAAAAALLARLKQV